MIRYGAALQQILAQCAPLPPHELPLAQALGGILAENVRAAADLPPFDNSAMDGFALVCAGKTLPAGSEFTVVGSQAAGDGSNRAPIPPAGGDACEIMTGASLPAGFDAVIPIEQVCILEQIEERPWRIRLDAPVQPGAHVRRHGQDVPRGQCVLHAGSTVTPAAHMLLAALGMASVAVRGPVPVALLSTGRELIDDPGQPLAAGQIRNSNGPYLSDRLREAGARVVHAQTVSDVPAEFLAALERSLAAGARVLLSTGAVSMGRHDFIADALRGIGAQIVFHKVAIRPGKPLLFGQLRGGQLYFGLPGNPVAGAVGMRFFVEPALRALLGQPSEQPLRLPLAEGVQKKAGFRFLQKACVQIDADARLSVRLLQGQESFRILPLLLANAWAVLAEDARYLPAGTLIEVHGLEGRGVLLDAAQARARGEGAETARTTKEA